MKNYWLDRKKERETPARCQIEVDWGAPITCTCTITIESPSCWNDITLVQNFPSMITFGDVVNLPSVITFGPIPSI